MKKRIFLIVAALVFLLAFMGMQAFASDRAVSTSAIASWASAEPTIDGNANESDWLIYNDITGAEGTPVGTFGKLWRGENLYLAVNTGGASSMSLTLNTSYTLTVNLSGSGSASGMSGVTVKKNGNTVEMKIPFASFGFTLRNYTDTVPMSLSLTNASGTSSFGGSLGFSSRAYTMTAGGAKMGYYTPHSNYYGTGSANAIASGQAGHTSTADGNGNYTLRLWNKYLEGQTNYGIQSIYGTMQFPIGGSATGDLSTLTGSFAVDFDVRIDDMAVYQNPTSGYNVHRMYQPAGLGIYFANKIPHNEFNLSITHTADGLVLFVGHGPFTDDHGRDTVQWDGPYKLNKELGETFHVTLQCMEDGRLGVYVDDVLIYALKDVAIDFPNCSNGLQFNLWSPFHAVGYSDDIVDTTGAPKNSDFNTDVSISNVQLGNITTDDILNLVDFDDLKGENGAFDSVYTDLNLPATISDGRLTSQLTWTSSKPDLITNTGAVAAGNSETAVTMTATLTGTTQTKAVPLTVSYPSVDAWYGENITLDGAAKEYYDFARGYTFASGEAVAARWNDEKVYLAVKDSAVKAVTVTVNGQALTAETVKGSGVTELSLPRSAFGTQSQDVTVTIGSISKVLTLEFFGKPASGFATYGGTVTIDGAMNETAWQLYGQTQGRNGSPEGLVGKVWTSDALYLAVFVDDAKSMKLTVGSKTATIDLTAATLKDSSGLVSNIARGTYIANDGSRIAGGLVEMKIPFANFGFALYNYDITTDVAVELTNEVGVSAYTAELAYTNTKWIGYSGVKAGNPSYTEMQVRYANQMSGWDNYITARKLGHVAVEHFDLTNDRYSYHMWNKYQKGSTGFVESLYANKTIPHLSIPEGTAVVDFDMRVDAMRAYTKVAHAQENYGNNGLTLTLDRGIEGNDLKVGISRLQGQGLVFVIHEPGTSKQLTYPLGRDLGESFHLSMRWGEDGSLSVYVDDTLLLTKENAGGNIGVYDVGYTMLALYSEQTYNPATSSATDIDFTVSNMLFGTAGNNNLLNNLTFDDFKGSNRDEKNISSSMTLPTSLTDGNLTSQLTWTSSNSAITISGSTATVNKVTEDTPVTLTATLKGSNPAVSKTFELVVRRPVLQSQLLPNGSSITVDGTLSEAEYASDSYYVLPYNSVEYKLASRWDKENIYVAFRSAYSFSGMPDTLVLTFGDKTATVTLSSGTVSGITGATGKSAGGSFFTARTVEVCIPRSALGVEIPEYYHNEDFTVTVKKGSTTHVTLPMRMEFCGYDSIAEEYIGSADFAALKTTLSNLSSSVTLPTSYTSQYVDGSVALSWKSDTPRFLTNAGVLHQTDKEDALVRLTLSSEGEILTVVEANVKSKYGKDLHSSTNIMVPFGSGITVDGAISEQGWSINNNITDGKTVAGKMGAQWDAENLYLAINPGTANSVAVTVEGKTATINLSNLSVSGTLTVAAKAKGSTYLEVKIPLSQLGISKIQNYGQKLSCQVALGSAQTDLSMTLSSLQYFATDNPEHRYVITSKSGNADLANTSHSITESGYYFYQNYEYGGENLGGKNGYLGFNNSAYAGSEIFAPMEQSGKENIYTEFDFQALSMPVYTGNEEVQANKPLFASNGIPWQIGGYANSAQSKSQWLSLGIYNTEQGLVMAVKTDAETHAFALGKKVGDMFRLGTLWMADHTLQIYVDGKLIYTVENAARIGSTVNAGGMTFQYVRSADPAVCDADSIRVNIGNVAMGNYYGDNLLDGLTFDDIKGSNTSANAITSNLTLPTTFGNSQLTGSGLTWTSSNESVISSKGVANTNIDSSYGMATLTASDAYGNTKSFNLIVPGKGTCDNVLYVEKDFNPAAGVGKAYSGSYFTFDTNNRSLVYVLDSKQPVNVVKLTELDSNSRIYEDMLTLWYSDDNATYTEVKDFKLLHLDNSWYVYDFNVNAKYIKLHSTHFDSEECMVEGFFPDMLRAYHEDVFGDNGGTFANTKTATVTNSGTNDKVDYPFCLNVADLGLTSTEDIRVLLDGELLYHYVEEGKLYVRVPRVKAGSSVTLTILSGNADALNIANKEAVYEVIYGTREGGLVESTNPNTYMRIMYTLPDGTIIKMNRTGRYRTWSYSTDGGRTWAKEVSATSYTSTSSAGYHKGYAVGGFVYDDVGNVLYTYGYGMPTDGGLTQMHMHKLDLTNGVANAKWEYVGQVGKELYDQGIGISNYNHGTTLSCSDGEGPNVDMLFAVYSNSADETDVGADRVFYTKDGGKTWLLSETRITFTDMQAGFEMGVSEPTTLELEDGTVVMLCRYQADDSISFAYSYSKDHGVTWSVPIASEVYSSNTQPMFHETHDEFDLFVWAGNNQHGGTSYQRYPMNVAIPVVDEDNLSLTAVQDLYSKYIWQDMTGKNRNTNLYLTHTPDGALLIAWYMPMPDDLSYFLRVDDYKDVVLKTKGAYDSFESGSLKYEGWSSTAGAIGQTNALSTDGDYSMQMYGTAIRSLPYFRAGSVSFDLYWEAGTGFKMELQTSHNRTFGAASPVSFTVDKEGNVFFGDVDSGLNLQSGWNTLSVEMDLPNQTASLSANGGKAVAMPIHEKFNEYVCYVSLHADNFVYVDNFINIGEEAPIYDHTCVAGEPVVEDKVDATCTKAGSYDKVLYCTGCGKEISRETVEVPKLGHKSVTLPAVPATCTATGLTQGMKCSVCETVLVSQKLVDMLPHTEVTIPGKAATCLATGLTDGVKCESCGTTLVEQTETPKTGHTAVVDAKVDPTCTTTGLTQGMHCSGCGKVLASQTVIAKLDHEYGYANITGDTHDKVCSVGGESVTEDHAYTDGFCACGAEEPVSGPAYDAGLKLTSISLSLQESVCMQFIYQKSKVPAGYDVSTFYLEYTQMVYNKETGTFEPETGRIDMDANSTSSYAKFTRGFVSWAMTEEITITIYGEKDGVLYRGESYTTTVEKEAMTKFTSYKDGGYDAYCTVVADMLNYGAAVQQKESYNTANLANANFTDEHRAYETKGTPEASGLANGTTGEGTINPLRVAMSLQDKVILQVLIRTDVMTAPENYEVRFAKDGNVEAVIDCAGLEPTSGVLRANFAVRADSMSVAYTITIHEKATGTQVSNVNTFSVVARAEELYNDATYGAQAIALVKYGNAVNAAFG